MISPQEPQIHNEQSGVLLKGHAHIKKQNLHIVLQFLREKCYSDITAAILREYATNAADVHIRYGITTPFQVTLPDMFDSFLKIRDFGPALEDHVIMDMFLSYAESDKRGSEKETGSLGIGCKCAFAYGDSFTINSYRQGKLSIWSAYIDPSNEGTIALMATTETTEPDGLEIVIPIKNADIYEVREKALRIYSYFNPIPHITNLTPSESENWKNITSKKAAFSGQGWKFFADQTSAVAVMANVHYGLSAKPFQGTNLLSNEQNYLLNHGLVVEFQNGELDFAISREELQYTERTKLAIVARLKQVESDIVNSVQTMFQNVTNLWDAKALWEKIFSERGELYSLRSLFGAKIKFNGQPIQGSYILINDDVGQVFEYTASINRVSKERVHRLTASDKHILVKNDMDITNGISNRVVALLMKGGFDRVYVVKFLSPEIEQQWKTSAKMETYNLVNLSLLPKHALSDFFPTEYLPSPKATSKEFTFIRKKTNNNWHYAGRVQSNYWEIAEVDLTNGVGIYVELLRFEYKNKNGFYQRSINLNDILNQLEEIGIQLPPQIFGLKKASVEKVQKNPNMMNFWVWLASIIEDFAKNHPVELQNYYNASHLQQLRGSYPSLSYWAQKIVAFSKIDKNGLLVKTMQEYITLNQNSTKVVDFNFLSRFGTVPSLNPSCDLTPNLKALSDRYPLLFLSMSSVDQYQINFRWVNALEDYIVMVETCSQLIL